MNRILQIINGMLLVAVLVIVIVALAESRRAAQNTQALSQIENQVTTLSGRMEELPTSRQINVFHEKTSGAAALLDKRVAALEKGFDQMAGRLRVLDQSDAEIRNQIMALRSARSGTIPGPTTRSAAPTTEARSEIDAIALDLSGPWLDYNKPTPNIIKISLVRLAPDKYKMVSAGNAHGIYEVRGDRLVMTEPGSKAYAHFIWQVESPGKLVLLTTEYRGSVLMRSEKIP
jgi:hypothetical protein